MPSLAAKRLIARRKRERASAVQQSRAAQQKRKTRMRHKNVRRMRYNAEIKSVEQSTSSFHKLEFMAGSDTKGPNNSLVLLPGLYEKTSLAPTQSPYLKQGTDEDEVVGRWITVAYPYSQKFTINYQSLTAKDNLMPSPNITVIIGMVKNTGEKISADLTTMGSWTTDIRELVLKQLYDSGFDSHHCSYREQNRNLKILHRYTVKPKPAQHKVGWNGSQGAQSDNTWSPNNNLTVRFQFPRWKTRLEKTGDDYLVPNNTWIPFTLFMADSLSTLDQGYVGIETASKFWFKDT